MIILPDRNEARSKFLLPMRRRDWMLSSQSTPKDQFGNDTVCTVYRIRARLHDGYVVWKGVFRDRDDFDAFLFALASGSLSYRPDLWRLPTPNWYPGIAENLFYDFATVTFLTNTGATQTYYSPVDWNNANNSIEGLGGGGSGGSRQNSNSGRASGGGGGEYRKITNYTFATPGTSTASYDIGSGGSGGSIPIDGGNTAWNTTSLIAVGGKKGDYGPSGSFAGGAGGTGGTGAGGNYNGGSGGSSSGNLSAGGGGGAAGPNGAGGNGGNAASANAVGAGGNGDNGSGGAGSAGGAGASSSAGGNGTEWQSSPAYGSGGGSGGARNSSNVTSGAGGNYGAGSGGCVSYNFIGSPTARSGSGAQGLIVVTYTPVSSSGLVFTIPMMGL